MISRKLTEWEADGEYITYGSFQHKLFVKQVGSTSATSDKTLLLIHGFPESSYSYHAIVDGMLKLFDRIILFDMLGYGWSDKPTKNYSYSLLEQADTAFEVWKHFGVNGGHMLSHDMGDSVATEIVARHEEGKMPSWFSDDLQSITFTNGSMVLELASLRVAQKILLSSFGHIFSQLTSFKIFKHQIRSAHGNQNLPAEEIKTLWDSNTLQNGQKKAHLTIKYYNDRKQFEKTRWLPALAKTKVPIHICWGTDDAVAKVAMAHYLKDKVCQGATLTIMNGLGHFCQLGSPKKWMEYVGAFYEKIQKPLSS